MLTVNASCSRDEPTTSFHTEYNMLPAPLAVPSNVSLPSKSVLPNALSTLHDHDCLLSILGFLSWEDLNVFALASKECCQVRNHPSLDQTRSGTISLGKGVSNIKELMEKARREQWSNTFCGHRTHLRLSGLTYLSSNIDPVTQDFVNTIAPLSKVQSLDCSIVPKHQCVQTGRPWFLAPFEDYVDKGFAQGLTLSLLVPNLKAIDMSHLPLTLVGVAWLAENNPILQSIRWNRSLIWPISNDSCAHLKAMQNIKEVFLDYATFIFCSGINEQMLWDSLSTNSFNLERVSLRGARWYKNGCQSKITQDFLVKFALNTPSLKWFRSDLSPENAQKLRKARPDLVLCN